HQVVSLSDPVGHWRPVEAFDDRQGVFVTSDPYLGADYRIRYGDFAAMWAQRGYAFMILYPTSRQAVLTKILAASGWNKTAAFKRDLALVRANQLDASPTASPQSAKAGYRYLAMAWDEGHMGQRGAANPYLDLATRAGANPIEVGWVRDQIA
ncbi:MAG: hypothetical protein ACRDGS_11880, partial [Chloroflexota bacterium]